jgi:hypothetical protein
VIYRYEKDLIITANNQYQHQMKETSTQVKEEIKNVRQVEIPKQLESVV